MSSFLNNQPTDDKAAEVAYDCLINGDFAQGYTILKGSADSKNFDILFNLGLCFLGAKDFEKAAEFFEKALNLSKSSGLGSPQKEQSAVYITLRRGEISRVQYLKPLCADFIARFPIAARENITMALITALKNCGQNDSAKRLTAALIGDEFIDFKGDF